ncbi:MAG: IS66 family transposase [Gemmatimonadota bacterium]|nr:IS66 family transposase [Gemmatimonadota bacterium]
MAAATSELDPAGNAALPTPEQLPDDLVILKRMILELLATLHEERLDKNALRHRLELLARRLFGPRGERFDPNQLLLFAEQQAAGQETAASPAAEQGGQAEQTSQEKQEKPKRKCKPHGRRRLPENLRRQTKHLLLTEAERTCSACGQVRQEIGTQKSEHLDYQPASLFVVESIVHKYACPCCSKAARQTQPNVIAEPERVRASEEEPRPAPAPAEPAATQGPMATAPEQPAQDRQPSAEAGASAEAAPPQQPVPTARVVIAAPKPAMPIAKGLPGPGLLAHLIVSKYVDHLPLYRLERSYERQGVFLPRSTLCDWLLACGQLLLPLYQVLVARVLQSLALHTDDTPVKLQDTKTHLLSTARLWAYLGDAGHPFNVFDFTVNRKRDGPQSFLASYHGYLHADAFGGYDCLYLPDPRTTQARIIEVACNAHARRKFYEARTSDAVYAHTALAYYQELYELERVAKEFSEPQRLQLRQELSVPILDKFRVWIDAAYEKVLPKSPMAEALGYARNNWTALVRYTEAGYLAIDNNVAEREMKRIAIGRKNWLFIGSPQGGQAAAVLMSFTSTCKRLRVEPWAYLQDVLSRLPTTPAEQVGELAPDKWQAAQRARQAGALESSPETAIPSAESDS